MDSDTSVRPAEDGHGRLDVSEDPRMRGGYADIYHGFWTNPQGERFEVAVKELRDLIPRDQQTTAYELNKTAEMRIAREVSVWSRLQHPNIHPLLDYQSQPRPRFISPWCRHGNLSDYLKAHPSLSRLDKLTLIYEAGSGLEHLHSRTPPISHADIKPENILINDWRGAALSDFGLSRVLHGLDIPSGFTTSGIVKGTPNYMSKELFAGENPTRSSDVYAFGGLILNVMSGKPPFGGLPQRTILSRVMQDQPPRLEDHPALPQCDPLWGLMRRCWDPDPTARPSTRRVLWQLWELICQEKGDQPSRPGLSSVTDGGSREDSAMDLDISDSSPHQEGSSSMSANSVPAQSSLSRITGTAGTRGSIARGIFSPAQEIFKKLEVNSKAIPVFGKYIRAAVEVGFMLMEIVKTIDRNHDMASALESDAWRLAVFLDRLRGYVGGKREDEIGTCIADIKRELQSAQGRLKEMYSLGLTPRAMSCCDHEEPRKRWEGTVVKAWETTEVVVSLDTATLMAELIDSRFQDDQRRLLNCLGDGKYGAQGNAIEDVLCLPGTRVRILKSIDKWIRDTSNANRVFWIRGMAGRGKSTIASTVAHCWQYRASCALFHYRQGQDALNGRIVCALARQLACSLVPEVRRAVLDSVRENQDIADQRLSVQFETLLVAPLSTLKCQLQPIVIVVDALDECGNPKDAEDFVKLLDRCSSSLPLNVKFLLTCRPEAALLRTPGPRSWHVESLDSSPDVMDDLARFCTKALRQIREEHGLSEDWPSSGDVSRLVEMSQGLFQWARTAITYIDRPSAPSRLHDLLNRSSMWNGLDDLYNQILSKAIDNIGLDPSRRELLCQILGILVVAPHPVSLEVITVLCWNVSSSILAGTSQDTVTQRLRQDILADLHSLLLIPSSSSEPLCLMHTSIRDLLVSEQRCKGQAYYINVAQHHQRLADMCLNVMVRSLKENICEFSDLSKANSEVQDIMDRKVSMVIRYCCRAWSIHLTEGAQWSSLGTESASSMRSNFEIFSREKALFWLEIMSLVGATTEAMVTARRVHQWLSESPGEPSESKSVNDFWIDVQRFIAMFLEPIKFGSLHIYVSALAHCPQKTTLWEWYGRHARIRTVHTAEPSTWLCNLWTRSAWGYVAAVAVSPDSTTLASGYYDGTIQLWDVQTGTVLGKPLQRHGGPVFSVAFSPDGRVLASGSYDRTIRLWDTLTGMVLGEPFQGHSRWAESLAFSPDSKVLASGSSDGTIQLWDAQTGAVLGEPLQGHGGSVKAVAFSPDGKALTSAFSDRTIRLWDARTGTVLGESFQGPGDFVFSVAFSPDGKVLASGFNDRTIRLWDAQTATVLGEPLQGHGDSVNSVAFSPDGRVLASGSEDRTIRLWVAQTGTILREPLHGHDGSVNVVAFSPDGKVLASGSNDATIRLWDAQTGTVLGEPLQGHDYSVFSIAFSPDGKVLASGSHDSTIRLWDAQTGGALGEPLQGHGDCVLSVAFSPDGKVLASGSYDGTIRLWDAHTGTVLGEMLPDDGGSVFSVAFSPDGKVLASGYKDCTIRLWDAQTGTVLDEPLQGHDDSVQAVAFSPDGKALASGSGDGTIRLWDAQTGKVLDKSLRNPHYSVDFVAFSPDGNVLASGSDHCTIRLWDAETGTALGEPFQGHGSSVRSVAFSPDGKVLVSGSDDRTIRLWDLQTGMVRGESLQDRGDSVRSVAFSPDGKVLASGSDDSTIRLWDAQTGTVLGEPLQGHGEVVHSVAFSPDGQVLASGSHDCTIRLWDAQTGAALGEPLQGHGDPVFSVAFSPDGKVLASGSNHGTIRLWDPVTGIMLGQPFRGHGNFVKFLAFSPDSKALASATSGWNGTIRLLDAQTGTVLGEYCSEALSLTFSPDGKVLEFQRRGGWTHTWEVQTDPPRGVATEPCHTHALSSRSEPHHTTTLSPLPLWPVVSRASRTQGSSLYVHDHWLMSSSSRLLWLPAQYWNDSCPSIHLANRSLAIVSKNRLSIFNISGMLWRQ